VRSAFVSGGRPNPKEEVWNALRLVDLPGRVDHRRTDPGRFAAFAAFQDGMAAREVLVAGARLRPTSSATTVRVRDNELVIADGPFAETKEQIAGLYLIDCQDLDEAIEVASHVPAAQWGTIEVRPVWDT
jgi:hypothetical protein